MFSPIWTDLNEMHHQDMLREAAHERLVKKALTAQPTSSVFSFAALRGHVMAWRWLTFSRTEAIHQQGLEPLATEPQITSACCLAA
jgi:hypothetical protein